MMVTQDGASRRRGRPRSAEDHRVYESLVLAAGECLREKLHTEITAKDIAARAGTAQAMIQYYFGGKDGLMFAVIEKNSKDLHDRLRILKGTILTLPGRPIRHVIKALVDSYAGNSHVCRVTLCEFQKSQSAIKDQCFERLSKKTISGVHAILEVLVDNGIYARREDMRYLAFSLVALSFVPIILAPMVSRQWFSLEEMNSDSWVDYLTELVDGAHLVNGRGRVDSAAGTMPSPPKRHRAETRAGRDACREPAGEPPPVRRRARTGGVRQRRQTI